MEKGRGKKRKKRAVDVSRAGGSGFDNEDGDDDERSIDWKGAESDVPGVSHALSGAISNIRGTEGRVYESELDRGEDRMSSCERDEECWLEWYGVAFDFSWKGTVRRFVTRTADRGGTDCVLDRCSQIESPYAHRFIDDWKRETLRGETGSLDGSVERDHDFAWQMAAYVVNNHLK